MPAGVGPPTSAWWARQAAKPSSSPPTKTGEIERDVGQVGAAAVGVVEDPGLAGPLLEVEHGGDRVGHRAEVDGDVLGLHHQLAAGVEERGRAVVALLDVGRVGGADQGRAHLLAGGAQAADHHLQRDRVEAAHRCASARIVPVSSTVADQPGGTTKVASGSSKTTGPSASSPGRGLAAQDRRLDPLAVEADLGGCSLERGRRRRRRPAWAAARGRPARGGCGRGRPRRRGRGGRSAPRGRARSARRGRPGRGGRRRRPAARTPGPA